MKRWTSLLLILANVPAALGLLFHGWGLKEVILLYWLETVLIGLFSILKTLIARANPEVVDWLGKYGAPVLWAYKILIACLVTVVVGVYTLVTGLGVAFMLVVSDYGFRELPADMNLPAYMYDQMEAQNIWLALGIICLSHAFSFVYNFLIRGEYRTNQDRRQLDLLARRVAAIAYAVVPSMFLLVVLVSLEGSLAPETSRLLRTGPTLLLIVFKTHFDLRAHREEHAAGGAAGEVAQGSA